MTKTNVIGGGLKHYPRELKKRFNELSNRDNMFNNLDAQQIVNRC